MSTPAIPLFAKSVSNPPTTRLPEDLPLEEKILKSVCEHYGVSLEEILSLKKLPSIVHARRMAMHLLRKDAGLKDFQIANKVNKEIGAIIKGCRVIQDNLKTLEPDILLIRARYEKL